MSLKHLDALSVTVVGNHLWNKRLLVGWGVLMTLFYTITYLRTLGAAFLWTPAPILLSRNVDLISQSHAFHFFKTDMRKSSPSGPA